MPLLASLVPLMIPPQPLLTDNIHLAKFKSSSCNIYASYIQEDLPNGISNCNNVIMNVFGATVPRQRSSSIDEHILNLQRQTYEHTLSDHEYDTQLQNLVHSDQNIFETVRMHSTC